MNRKPGAENSNKTVKGRPFKKGVSGNPGGRPKIPDWFKEHTEDAQKRLFHWLNSNNAKASMQAAQLILAYGLGKPTEHHNITGQVTWEQYIAGSRE